MNVVIYTDGSAKRNPGKGGFWVVMIFGEHRKEISDGFQLTTNNRMELLSVIVALESLKKQNIDVVVYSDSKYVVNAVEKSWLLDWEKKSFSKKKNSDLWIRFLKVYRKHKVRFVWVKGHSNVKENERCDQLAVKAAESKDLKRDIWYENYVANNKGLF